MNAPTDAGFFADKEVTKTVRAVAEGLLSRIRAREYPAGSRLPAERHLASEFGVARNTVREALDLLEAHQIISRRAGSGSFITYQSEEDGPSAVPDLEALNVAVSEATSPLELQVVRGIVEPEMIRLAVINMAPRDIGNLKSILERMEGIQTDSEAYARAEEEFHMQIARGTENPLLIAIYALIIDVRRQAQLGGPAAQDALPQPDQGVSAPSPLPARGDRAARHRKCRGIRQASAGRRAARPDARSLERLSLSQL